MRRRQNPTVLMYGLGLALLLSLGFNSYLLTEQRGRIEQEPYPPPGAGEAATQALTEQLRACTRSNERKDSILQALQIEPPH